MKRVHVRRTASGASLIQLCLFRLFCLFCLFRRSRLFRLLCLPVLLFALFLPAPQTLAVGEAPEKDLTILVYMSGSDLESENGAASADLQEMQKAECDFSKVNLVVLAGGARKWHMGLNPEELSVIEIGSRGSRITERLPAASMGAPETLSSFLRTAVEEYPAREYALIFWNHGGGPMEGVCYDEKFGMDRLTLSELRKALSDSPFSPDNQLGWIGFDACMMASVETAHISADYAKYMIASQETEPSTGWNYAFLGKVRDWEDRIEVGRAIVESYMAGSDQRKMLTLSCVDLSWLGQVKIAMSDLYREILNTLTESSFSDLARERMGARGFGRVTTLSDYDLADLYELSERYADIAPEEAGKLQNALAKAVVYCDGNGENAHGLSVYSPCYNKREYTEKWLKAYQELSFPQTYLNYLNRYSSFWLSEQMADWHGLKGEAAPVGEDGSQTVTLRLTEDQEAHFASAKVVILRDQGIDNTYFEVYEIDGLQPENGELRATYDYTGLFVTVEDGKPVSDIYPYWKYEGKYLVGAELENISAFQSLIREAQGTLTEEDNRAKLVNMLCELNQETGELEVQDVVTHPEQGENLGLGKQYYSISPAEWNYIWFCANLYGYRPLYNDSGDIYPYTQWAEEYISSSNTRLIRRSDGAVLPYSEFISRASEQNTREEDFLYFSEVDNREPWHLQFLKNRVSPQNLYAQFIVTDTQGVENGSALIPLYHPGLKGSTDLSLECLREDECGATLEGVDIIAASEEKGIRLRLRLENRTDRQMAFAITNLTLNRTLIDTTYDEYLYVSPQSVSHQSIFITANEIPRLEPRLKQLSFYPVMWPRQSPEAGYMGDVLTVPVDLDLESLGIPLPDGAAVFAECLTNGMKATLEDLREEADGSVSGLLHLVSLDEETHKIYFHSHEEDYYGDVTVNGHYIRDCMFISRIELYLAPGGDGYFPFVLSRNNLLRFIGKTRDGEEKDTDSVFSSEDMFSYWDIRELSGLSFLIDVDSVLQLLSFTLENPLRLTYAGDREEMPPATPLLEGDIPVSLVLRSAEVTENGVRLMIDQDTEEDLFLLYTEASVNGIPADVRFFNEDSINLDSAHTMPQKIFSIGGVSRTTVELLPREKLQGNPTSVSFRIGFAEEPPFPVWNEEDYGWRKSEIVTVALGEKGQDPRAETAGMKPTLDLGAALGTDGGLIAEIPERTVQLRIPMTEEERSEAESGRIMLLVPYEGLDMPNVYFLLAELPALHLDGNTVCCDFCGLMAACAGADLPFTQIIFPAGEDWIMRVKYLAMLEKDQGVFYAAHADFRISEGRMEAETQDYDMDEGLWTEKRPEYLDDYLNVYRFPPEAAAGEVVSGDAVELLGWLDDVNLIAEDQAMLTLRSVNDLEGLQVVLTITRQDGTRWLRMLPYSECAVPLPSD